jgi:L-aminopeptidase/D-esterase-like protein
VAALAVVNAFGDVRDAAGAIVAGARGQGGEFVDTAALVGRGAHGVGRFDDMRATNTTLALVAVDAVLGRTELRQVAAAASAAILRRITPAGTTLDGDVVFALCPRSGDPVSPAEALMPFEVLAVQALEAAIERAVRLARGRDGIPGLADERHE